MLKLKLVVAVVLLFGAIAIAQEKVISANKALDTEIKAAIVAKDYTLAITKAKALDASEEKTGEWAKASATVVTLLCKTGKHAEARTWVSAKLAEITEDVTYSKQGRRYSLFTSIKDMAVNMKSSLADRKLAAMIALGVKLPDEKLSRAKRHSSRIEIYDAIGEVDNRKLEEIKYLKVAGIGKTSDNILLSRLPSNDVTLCTLTTAQDAVNRAKLRQRRETGKVNATGLIALADQLTKGGEARPLIVTDEAKALATAIGIENNPYLVNLLNGNHVIAFQIAWARAKASTSDKSYLMWINRAAGALRCHEQHYNGNAIEFIKFVNGTIEVNPVADLLESE